MFYIDFTSPEGKTYRIDVSTHPVRFQCPVCGEVTVYAFEKDDEDYCSSCAERRQQQELEEMDARLYRQLANYINRERNCHITPEEAEYLLQNPAYINNYPELKSNPKIMVIYHGR